MRVFILALGTRGDVEPLLFLARKLHERRHRVVVGTSGFYISPIDSATIRHIQVGRGSFEQFVLAIRFVMQIPNKSARDMAFVQHWMRRQIKQSQQVINENLECVDYLITNIPTIFIRPSSKSIMPGTFVTYEPPDPLGQLPNMCNSQILNLVAVSSILLDPECVIGFDRRVTGFWSRPLNTLHDKQLQAFIEAGSPPVVLTLGSMVVLENELLAVEFLLALKATGIRGVLVRAQSRVIRPIDTSNRLLVIDEADYSWLFPRSALVIHHGGSGTVAAVLRAGVPSIVRAYIGSQQRYADILIRHGLCTGLLNTHPLRSSDIVQAIRQSLEDRKVRIVAQRWRQALELEADGLEQAVELVEVHGRYVTSKADPSLAPL